MMKTDCSESEIFNLVKQSAPGGRRCGISALSVALHGIIVLGGDVMTDRQGRFADEYLIDCNATRAYKAAYPSVKKDEAARVNASRLLSNANIRAYIDEQLEKLHDEKTADAAEVLEYLTAVMRGQSRATVSVVVGTGDGKSEAVTVNKAPDEKERLKAAELLGKRFGLFRDKVDVSGAAAVTIIDDMGAEDD